MINSLASFLFLAFSLEISHAFAITISGTVTQVRDGDTVQLTTEQGERLEVRLNGIDAPEKGQKRKPGQPFAEQSKDMLERLAANEHASLETTKTDRYGSRVGVLWVDTGNGSVDAGLLQIQMGMAWTYPQYLTELSPGLKESYKYAEAIAKLKRRGLWADEKPRPPWNWRK